MKPIDRLKKLEVNKINDEDINIKTYQNENSWIIEVEGKNYLIIRRRFLNKINNKINEEQQDFSINIKKGRQIESNNLDVNYGNNNSIIVDMNGIDNFRFAKSEVFYDYVIRKIVKKMKLLNDKKKYLRIGASGARECDFHPGGEVFEYSLINGKDLNGISQNVSGYLPKNECYSKSISLYDKDKISLREERIVYSHTAWLEECDKEMNTGILLDIKMKKNKKSLLDIINEIAKELNFICFSIQIFVRPLASNDTEVIGRVLKRMPEKAFKDIPEVVEISYEKKFELEDTDCLYGMGTKYERYEPEWTEFTNGGKYERRGHIHATIISTKNTKNKKHETFHLRDIFVSNNSNIEVLLTPINTIYRIYPIHKENSEYFCDASGKNIKSLIEEIQKIDKNK